MFNLEHLLKLIDPQPILIDHQACLAARHKRAACRACVLLCPVHALSVEDGKLEVDASACTRCGLCAGACPTGALSVRGVDEPTVLKAGSVHCSKADGSGAQVPCLGYLTADHLLEMGLRQESLDLVSGDCATCPWQTGGAKAAEAVNVAQGALTALGSAHSIRLVRQSGDQAAGRSLSRRDLLNLWRSESIQVAKQFVPERTINHAKLPAKVPARRSRWLRQVEVGNLPQEQVMPAGPWKGRVVSEACNGCSICVSFCPTGAFSKGEENGEWFLLHQPAACVSCDTCVQLCPTRAVGEEPIPASVMASGEVREVTRLTKLRCRTCRKEFRGRPGESQCPACRSISGVFLRT